MRNLERAAQCYAAALQLRPNFPEALNNMAVIYTSQAGLCDCKLLCGKQIMPCMRSPLLLALATPLQTLTLHCISVAAAGSIFHQNSYEPDNLCRKLCSYWEAAACHALWQCICFLYMQGRAHDALQLLQAALLSAPEYAEAWNTLGVLQRDMGQMQVNI